MPEYSPEPWTFSADGLSAWIVDAAGNNTSFGGEAYEGAVYETDPDAQRAVACVNAMAGVADPQKLMDEVRALALVYSTKGALAAATLIHEVKRALEPASPATESSSRGELT